MPFTFLVDLLYKFKTPIFVVLAAFSLVTYGYVWHNTAVKDAYNRGYLDGTNHVYEQIKNAPPKIEYKIVERWRSVPAETAKGKIDTQYVKLNLDSLTVDSLRALVHKLETPYTVTDNDSMMELTVKARPVNQDVVFLTRKYKCTDTTKTISKTIVKDFDGLNYAITGSVNPLGRTSVGAAVRYKQFLLGPSYQIVGPNPGAWYNRAQLNVTYFLD